MKRETLEEAIVRVAREEANFAKLHLVAHLTPEELERALRRAEDVETITGYLLQHCARTHGLAFELAVSGNGESWRVFFESEAKVPIAGSSDEALSRAAVWVKEHGGK